jgi:hypothetical protein
LSVHEYKVSRCRAERGPEHGREAASSAIVRFRSQLYPPSVTTLLETPGQVSRERVFCLARFCSLLLLFLLLLFTLPLPLSCTIPFYHCCWLSLTLPPSQELTCKGSNFRCPRCRHATRLHLISWYRRLGPLVARRLHSGLCVLLLPYTIPYHAL